MKGNVKECFPQSLSSGLGRKIVLWALFPFHFQLIQNSQIAIQIHLYSQLTSGYSIRFDVLSPSVCLSICASHAHVTFRDPESARRACVDPTPIIDGRRANCNLASLGRPRPALPFGRLRSPTTYLGGLSAARGAYVGSFGFQQPVSYGYQQSLMYSPYGYAAYGQEYVYPQGVYNPYGGQQYLHVYGVPGTVNTTMYPYNHLGQTVPGGHGYTGLQGYAMPSHQIVQFGGPSINAMTTSSVPTIQSPYPTGMTGPVPPQPQFILPAHSPQFMQGSGSDQNTG